MRNLESVEKALRHMFNKEMRLSLMVSHWRKNNMSELCEKAEIILEKMNQRILKLRTERNEIQKAEEVKKAGRPKKEDKKIPIGVKLPPWLNEWMKRQPESKAKLIETALVEYYQIPKHLQE